MGYANCVHLGMINLGTFKPSLFNWHWRTRESLGMRIINMIENAEEVKEMQNVLKEQVLGIFEK